MEGWSVYQDEGILRSADRVVRLEPRVMDVLIYLAAAPGAVVPKEEILEAVWGGAHVEEGVLTQAIYSLRRALGDDSRQPRFIQTIPKRGYRLMAPVERVGTLPKPPTPIRPVEVVPPEPAPPPAPAWPWKRWLLLGGTLLAALAVTFWLTRTHPRPVSPPPEPPHPIAPAGNRIVVLPFEDLGSPRPEAASFSKGLTEEITNSLTSLAALKVISRRSAQSYGGTHKPLSEIARELGVDFVLEGSTEWDATGQSRVRVRTRLIRAKDDTQIWSKAFDSEVSEVKDMFTVQSEISRQVSDQLGIMLTPEERRALRTPPTSDSEAYWAYRRGVELREQPSFSKEHVEKAVPMLERAVAQDPRFASAWAELSQTHCYLAFNIDRSPERVTEAKQALDRAVALDPDLLPVRLASVYFSYRCLDDYDAALAQLQETARRFPNNSEVLQTEGYLLRRKGQFREAAEALQSAFSLDPRAVKLVWAIGDTHRALRNHEAADHHYLQAIELAADQAVFWDRRALNQVAWTGDLDEARAILEKAPLPSDPGLLLASFKLAFYARDYQRALALLSPESLRQLPVIEQSRLWTLEAIARERMGDHPGALATAEANRVRLERLTRQFPKEPYYPAFLAIALAQLGRAEEAAALAARTVHDNRNDGFGGPNLVEFQAIAETFLGRRREAIGRLSRLLSTPYRSAITVHEMRLDPTWDPLRGDPEFEELLRRHGN